MTYLRLDGTEQPAWLATRELAARCPARTAMELGVRFSLREQD